MVIVTNKWHKKQGPHGLAVFFPSQGVFHGDVFIYFYVPKLLSHDKLNKPIISSAFANPERCVPERNSLNGVTCIILFLNPIYKNLQILIGTEGQTQLWRPQCPRSCCEFCKQTKCGPKMSQQNCPTRQATSQWVEITSFSVLYWRFAHVCRSLQYFMIAIPLTALENASLS